MVTTKQSLYVVLQKIIKKESKHTTGENHLITIKDCNLGTKKESRTKMQTSFKMAVIRFYLLTSTLNVTG